MKIKYLRLSKMEKEMVKIKFYNTSSGKYIKKQLTSALICAFLCIAVALYIIIDAFIQSGSLWNKIYGFIILAFGIAGLIAHRKIFLKKINEFVTNDK